MKAKREWEAIFKIVMGELLIWNFGNVWREKLTTFRIDLKTGMLVWSLDRFGRRINADSTG